GDDLRHLAHGAGAEGKQLVELALHEPDGVTPLGLAREVLEQVGIADSVECPLLQLVGVQLSLGLGHAGLLGSVSPPTRRAGRRWWRPWPGAALRCPSRPWRGGPRRRCRRRRARR